MSECNLKKDHTHEAFFLLSKKVARYITILQPALDWLQAFPVCKCSGLNVCNAFMPDTFFLLIFQHFPA